MGVGSSPAMSSESGNTGQYMPRPWATRSPEPNAAVTGFPRLRLAATVAKKRENKRRGTWHSNKLLNKLAFFPLDSVAQKCLCF